MNYAELLNQLKSNVQFFEDGHYYEVDKVRVKHTLTEILSKFEISPDYTIIPKVLLEKSANFGTGFHKLVQDYDDYGEMPAFTEDCYEGLLKSYVEAKQKVVASEYPVSVGTTLATCIDKIILDGDEVVVADIKTTSQKHLNSVRWQCSFGAYMLYSTCGIRADKGRLIWADKVNNVCEITDFDLVSFEDIEKFIKAIEKEDYKSYELVLNPDNKLLIPKDVVDKVQELLIQEKLVKTQLSNFKDRITELMRNSGVKKLSLDGLNITYVLPTEKKTFDSAKFISDNKDLDLSKYYKTTTVKDGVRITAK